MVMKEKVVKFKGEFRPYVHTCHMCQNWAVKWSQLTAAADKDRVVLPRGESNFEGQGYIHGKVFVFLRSLTA